jgi:hypothetical protein
MVTGCHIPKKKAENVPGLRVWSFDYVNHPSMDVLRHEISQLPSPDR